MCGQARTDTPHTHIHAQTRLSYASFPMLTGSCLLLPRLFVRPSPLGHLSRPSQCHLDYEDEDGPDLCPKAELGLEIPCNDDAT